MNSPNPIPNNGNGFSAGNASAFGGACAIVFIISQHMRGIDYPAGYEGALAVIISTVFVYVRAYLEKFTGVKPQ